MSLDEQERISKCARELGAFVGQWAIHMMFRLRDGSQGERVIDHQEAAKLLDISPKTLDRKRSEGVIRGAKIGNTWHYKERDIDEIRKGNHG